MTIKAAEKHLCENKAKLTIKERFLYHAFLALAREQHKNGKYESERKEYWEHRGEDSLTEFLDILYGPEPGNKEIGHV